MSEETYGKPIIDTCSDKTVINDVEEPTTTSTLLEGKLSSDNAAPISDEHDDGITPNDVIKSEEMMASSELVSNDDTAKKSLLSIVIGRGNATAVSSGDGADAGDIPEGDEVLRGGGPFDIAMAPDGDEVVDVSNGNGPVELDTSVYPKDKKVGIDKKPKTSSTTLNSVFGRRDVQVPTGPERALSIISWTELERVIHTKFIDQAVRMYNAMIKKKKYRGESRVAVASIAIKRCGSPPWMDCQTIFDAIIQKHGKKTGTTSIKIDESERSGSLENLAKRRKKEILLQKSSTKGRKYTSSSDSDDDNYDEFGEPVAKKLKSSGQWSTLGIETRTELENAVVQLYLQKQAELPPHKKNLPKHTVEDILSELGLSNIMTPSNVYNALRRYRDGELKPRHTGINEQQQNVQSKILQKAIELYRVRAMQAASSMVHPSSEVPLTANVLGPEVSKAAEATNGEGMDIAEGTMPMKGEADGENKDEMPLQSLDFKEEQEKDNAADTTVESPTVPDEVIQEIIEQLGATEWMTIEAVREGAKNNAQLGNLSTNYGNDNAKRTGRLSAAEKKIKIEEATESASLMYMEERKKARPFRLREGIVHEIIAKAIASVGLPKKYCVLLTPQNIRSRVFRKEAEEERKQRFLDREKQNEKRHQEEQERKEQKKHRLLENATSNKDEDNTDMENIESDTARNEKDVPSKAEENKVFERADNTLVEA